MQTARGRAGQAGKSMWLRAWGQDSVPESIPCISEQWGWVQAKCVCVCVCVCVLVIQLCLTLVTPWTVAHQDPLSVGFHRQACWSVVSFPSPGDLPDSRSEPRSPALQADSLPSEPPGKPSGKMRQDLKTTLGVLCVQRGQGNEHPNYFRITPPPC